MLMAFLLPWALNAQVVTIGTGTDQQNYAPIANYFNYSFVEMIYTAEEIAAGNPSGTHILNVGFDLASSGLNSKTYSIKIYMKNIDEDEFSSPAAFLAVSASDLVYDGTVSATVEGYVTVELDNPFAYSNAKNLLIAVNKTAGGYAGSSYKWNLSSTSKYQCLYKQTDTSPGYDIANLPTSPTRIQKHPNVQLTFGKPASCPKPSGLTASDITANSVELNWTETGIATSWQLCIDGDEVNLITVTPNPSYSLTELNPLSSHTVKARSYCSASDQSDWTSEISFTTLAVAEPVGDSWSDNFEGTTCGWDLINGTLTNKWAWGTATGNGGTHSLYISSDNGTTYAYSGGASFVYATKLLSFTDGKFVFSYDWQANGESNYDYLRAWLAPSSATFTPGALPDGTTYPSSYTNKTPSGWIPLDGGSKLNLVTAWQTKEVVTNVAAGNYYFVFMWCNDGSGGSQPPAAVDNVIITKLACPYDVADLAVSSISTSGATLTWTAGEALQWQVAYADNSSFENATEQIVSAASVTLSGLQHSTVYYAKVRAYCGGSDFGAWSDVISFATECEAIDLSQSTNDTLWFENFDSYTAAAGFLPICWNRINTCSYSSYSVSNYPRIYGSSANSASNCLYLYSYYYNSSSTDYDPQPQYAILPEMSNLAGKQITLWAKGSSATSTFKIGVMSYPADANTFVAIADEQTLTTSYQEFIFNIPANATASYVAIMIDAANSTRSTNGVYIDDIVIAEPPACPKPTYLAYSEVEKHSVKLSWTNGDEETKWNVAYKADGDADYTLQEANSNPYILSGLNAETTYSVKVQANCGDTQSEWSNEVNFTTSIACMTPLLTNSSISDITASSAQVSWAGDAESYVLSYRTAAYTVGFEENFDANSIPSDWTRYSGLVDDVIAGTATLTTTTSGWGSNSYAFGAYNMKVNVYGSYCKYWLVTPEIRLENGYTFSFDLALTDYGNSDPIEDPTAQADDRFVVLISTDKAPTWTILREWNNSESSYVYNTIPTAGQNISDIDISSYVGQNVKFAFYAESTASGGDNDLHIDNVHIGIAHDAGAWQTINAPESPITLSNLASETIYDVKVQGDCGADSLSAESVVRQFTTASACQMPDGLAANNITANSAKISWNAYGQTGFNLKYKASDASDWTQVLNITNEEYVINNLSANTAYEVQIQPICNPAAWSASLNFRTECETVSTLPWNEDFEKMDADIVPLCWDNSSSSSSTITSNPERIWGVYSYGENKMIRMYNYFVQSGTALINSPAIEIPSVGEYELTFDYSHLASCGAFKLNISEDDGLSFEEKGSYSASSTSYNYTNPGTFSEATPISLAAYAGKTIILQFFANADYSSGAIFVDNVSIHEIPSCFKPTGLEINYTGGLTAEVSWTGEATSYNIDVNGVVTNGVTSPYELSGLEFATTYEVKVQADCGSGNLSDWTSAASFSTDLCMPEDQCILTFELTDQYDDSWNGNAIKVVDVASGNVLGTLTNDHDGGSWSSYTQTKTLSVCNGREIQFSWVTGSYPGETSYVVKDVNGHEIFFGSGAMSAPVNYTVDCRPSFNLEINATGYATFYDADNAYLMPDGLTGHAFSIANHLSNAIYGSESGQIEILPADEPVVMKAADGISLPHTFELIPAISSAAHADNNDLHGVNEATIIGSASDGKAYYVLSMNGSNDPESVGFYYMLEDGKGGFELPAHKAYLVVDNPSLAPSAFFLIDENQNATWLENLQGVEGTVKFMHEGNIYILRDSIIYDATGRKVRELK